MHNLSTRNKIFAFLVAAGMALPPLLAMPAMAGSAARMVAPVDYADDAKLYLTSRMEEDANPSFRLEGEPYRVRARLNGAERDCWAVDIYTRASLGAGRRSADTYTVLFYDGEPVALASDLRSRMVRIDHAPLYAAK